MASSIDPSAIIGQMTESFMKLPLIQKILIPLIIIGSISGIIFVSKWANQPGYVVLYSGLDPTDSAAVIERLKDQKIQYSIQGDGSTISVTPPEIVHELRITMAGEGIPKAGKVGFEIFESTNLGTTSFQEKIRFQRAIQGELERTITALDAVNSARVHVTQPEKSVFAKESEQPTASVMLRLRAGAELDQKQIKGISNLVAASVPGLTIENVKLIDVYGNLLTPDDEGAEEFGVEATRLSYQREIEKGYVSRIEQMLSKVLGPGKAVARVTAEMDFTFNEREEESFDPAGQVIRSERSVEEGLTGGTRGGIPGVVSNLSNEADLLAPQSADSENSRRKEELKNYEVSRAYTKTSSPRGTVKRISVAVLVDGTHSEVPVEVAEGEEAPQPVKEFQPLDSETLSRIESLVKSAVGYDAARGDTVTVENIPFFTPENNFLEEMRADATMNMISKLLYHGGPIIFVLFFFLFIVRPLVKFLVTPTEAEVDLTRLLPTGIAELEAELEAERGKAQIPELDHRVDLEQLEELIADNSRAVKEAPGQAALLIRYWLNDGRL